MFALIFQVSRFLTSAGFGTILFSGCRGFIGPVPPPLWMSIQFIFFKYYHKCNARSKIMLRNNWTKDLLFIFRYLANLFID